MKYCTCCKHTKSRSDFYSDKRTVDGKRTQCISCLAAKAASRYTSDPEQWAQRSRRWRESNPERLSLLARMSRAKHPERYRGYVRKWKKANPDTAKAATAAWQSRFPEVIRGHDAARRARKLFATPSWDRELTDFVVREAYRLAKLRAHATGFSWHVDHVAPLKGRVVCGLHVWNNIAVIPATVNQKKNNSYDTSL